MALKDNELGVLFEKMRKSTSGYFTYWKNRGVKEEFFKLRNSRVYRVSKTDAFAPKRFTYNGERYGGIMYYGLFEKKEPQGYGKQISLRYAVLLDRRGGSVAVPLAFLSGRSGIIVAAVKTPVKREMLSKPRIRRILEEKFEDKLSGTVQSIERTKRIIEDNGLHLDIPDDSAFSLEGELIGYSNGELHF